MQPVTESSHVGSETTNDDVAANEGEGAGLTEDWMAL
jgi:hypothetical protein